MPKKQNKESQNKFFHIDNPIMAIIVVFVSYLLGQFGAGLLTK